MSEPAAPVQVASTGQWWVRVKGQAYGPYTSLQLQTFVAEGRVRPATQVSDTKDGVWVEARRVIGLMNHNPSEAANDMGREPGANVFVYAAIASGAWNAFTAALEGMGALCDLGPGMWLVRTPFSAGVIRNTLSQTLEHGDRFVVIDASRDRLAWFNLGPEVDVRISHVWNAPLKARQHC